MNLNKELSKNLNIKKTILVFTFLFIVIRSHYGQVTNISTGLWSNPATWANNAIPTSIDSVYLSYNIVIDVSTNCKALNTNGHTVTINPNVVFGIGSNVSDSTFADPRDGQLYPYKTIGTQVWMTKNLNYAVAGSWCNDNNAANCATYGRLYNWITALTVAPPGWHLPSDLEWTTLTNFLGGEAIAGGKMKSITGWAAPNIGATDSSGFAGLPGGSRTPSGASGNVGIGGYWWSSTASGTNNAWYRILFFNYAIVSRTSLFAITNGFSVRCVRD